MYCPKNTGSGLANEHLCPVVPVGYVADADLCVGCV